MAVRIISASDVGLYLTMEFASSLAVYQVELLPLSQRFSLKTSDILSAWREILKGECVTMNVRKAQAKAK